MPQRASVTKTYASIDPAGAGVPGRPIVRLTKSAVAAMTMWAVPCLAQTQGAEQAKIQAVMASPDKPGAKLASLERLAQDFKQSGANGAAAAALTAGAWIAGSGGDSATLHRLAANAGDLCTAARDQACAAKALNVRAYDDFKTGRLESALRRLQRAITLYTAAGKIDEAAKTRFNVASVRHDLGDHETALADLRSLEAVFRELEGGRHLNAVLLSQGQIFVEQGRLDEARAKAEEVLAAGRSAKRSEGVQVDGVAQAHAILGTIAARLGNAEAALLAHRRSIAAQSKTATPIDIFWVEYYFADSLVRLGRAQEAWAHLEAARPHVAMLHATARRDFHALLARAAGALGRLKEAVDAQNEVIALQERLRLGGVTPALRDALTTVAVTESRAESRRVATERARDQARAARELALTRWSALLGLLALVAVGVAIFLWLSRRQLKRKHAAISAERLRLAGEIHDTLLQGLSGVAQNVQLARHQLADDGSAAKTVGKALESAVHLARETMVEARSAIWDIREGSRRSILERIEAIAASFKEETGAEIEVEVEAAAARDLSSDAQDTISRVAREAIGNALRHGAPKAVRVALRRRNGVLSLSVSDDGRGFEPNATADGHWGIVGMRERLERLGGRLTLESAPGRGTRLLAELPV